jgi:hypothetical protein
MRPFGILIGNRAALHMPGTPGARLDHARRPRRRLDDSIADIFARAVASNNLDAASDLLTILETWHRRRATKYGRERRIGDAELKAMRANLVRLTALRTS